MTSGLAAEQAIGLGRRRQLTQTEIKPLERYLVQQRFTISVNQKGDLKPPLDLGAGQHMIEMGVRRQLQFERPALFFSRPQYRRRVIDRVNQDGIVRPPIRDQVGVAGEGPEGQ